MDKLNITNLKTEASEESFKNIDTLNSLEIVKLINNEDKKVAYAVEKVLADIAVAAEEISKRMIKGGRIVYIGAGSSGRIGVLDAVELQPTYNVPNDKAFGILAGGEEAMLKAIEGVEDSYDLGVEEIEKINLSENDVLIGIAASGRTPFTLGAISKAKENKAYTIAITNNEESKFIGLAESIIAVNVGPEVISGSTRMKAGTSQKMVVNLLSTTAMILSGKVYDNYMVHVQATNDKLVIRSINMIAEITSLDYSAAEALFNKAKTSVAHAIVMHETGLDYQMADKILKTNHGHVKQTITDIKEMVI